MTRTARMGSKKYSKTGGVEHGKGRKGGNERKAGRRLDGAAP